MGRSTVNWWQMILWAGVLLITLAFLFAVRGVLLPFIVAFIISVLLDPSITKLRKRGISRRLSVLSITLAFFLVIAVIGLWAVPKVSNQISGFSKNLRVLIKQVGEADSQTIYTRWNPVARIESGSSTNPLDNMLLTLHEPLEKFGLPSTRRALVEQYVEPNRPRIAKAIDDFFNGFLNLVFSAGSKFFLLIFTPLFVVLMLNDFEHLKVSSAGWIPTSIRAETVSLLHDIGQVFVAYLRGVTISVGIYTLVMSVVLTVLGAPYSIVLALLTGSLYLIPYIGPMLSATSILVATGLSGISGNFMFHAGDPWSFGLMVMGGFLLVHYTYDSFITPQLMGKAVGLNMLASMFVVFSGGALFGIAGMILAFPVAGSVKVILERVMRATTSTTVEHLRLPATPLRHRSSVEV